MLAGVLRSNSVLTSLNIAQGDIGDYEREEIGRALLANRKGRVGFCDVYNIKEQQSHIVDLKDKEQIVQGRVNTSSSTARYANTPEARREIAEAAAKALVGSEAEESVFGLAASMAHSDLIFHAREAQVLDILASALSIEKSKADEIQSRYQ